MKYLIFFLLSFSITANSEIGSAVAKTKIEIKKETVAKNKTEQKKSLVTAQAEKNLKVKVTYDDKISEFLIIKEKTGGTLHFTNSEGLKKDRHLTDKDMKYLISEASSLKGSNTKSLCNRQYIELTDGKKQTTGCIGSETKIAKQLLNISNLLSEIVKL